MRTPKYNYKAMERQLANELKKFNDECLEYVNYWLISKFKKEFEIKKTKK